LQQWHDRWKKCVRSQGEYFQNYWVFLAISTTL
jgi:hypothetical protein